MKKNGYHILSLIVLLTFVGQIIVSSLNCFSTDEKTEELSEIGMEDSIDEELDTDIFFYDHNFLVFQENDQITVSNPYFHYKSNKYHVVEISITVPPPQQIV